MMEKISNPHYFFCHRYESLYFTQLYEKKVKESKYVDLPEAKGLEIFFFKSNSVTFLRSSFA